MKLVRIGILLIAVSVLCGCFDYDEDLVLNADGSGTIRMRIAMAPEQAMLATLMAKSAEHEMPGDSVEDADVTLFDRGRIEASLTRNGGGASLLACDYSESDSLAVYELKFAFSSTDDLVAVSRSLFGLEAMPLYESDSSSKDHPILTFTDQGDGTWLFSRPLGDGQGMDDWSEGYDGDYEEYEDYSEPGDDSDETAGVDDNDYPDDTADSSMEDSESYNDAVSEVMTELEQYKFRLTVTFPGEVIESNADSVNGNFAAWELSVAEMSQGQSELHAVIKK